MDIRFEQLYQLPNNLYTIGSPIVISAGALLNDTITGNIIVQLKFQSVSDKHIKAVKLSIVAYDVIGKELPGVEGYQYLDLNESNGDYFGSNKAIIMPNTFTRSFDIENLVVVFSDNSIWAKDGASFTPIPTQTTLETSFHNNELIAQYQILTNSQARFAPQDTMGIWVCACGEINSSTYCKNCTLQKDVAFSAYNIHDLSDAAKERIAKENKEKEERERQIAIQQKEQARIEAELLLLKKQKRRKRIRIFSIISAIFITLAILTAFWIYPKFITPIIQYKKANNLFNEGQYYEAKALFESLYDYSNSQARAAECEKTIINQSRKAPVNSKYYREVYCDDDHYYKQYIEIDSYLTITFHSDYYSKNYRLEGGRLFGYWVLNNASLTWNETAKNYHVVNGVGTEYTVTFISGAVIIESPSKDNSFCGTFRKVHK